MLIPRTPSQLVLQALAMVAVLQIVMLVVFRYHYHTRLPLWFWVRTGVFDFVLFASLLWFMRWLHQKREEWTAPTNRWFGAALLVLAVVLFALAFYIRVAR